jgi:rhamnogalacturonyl hydrolase YesR
MLLNSNNIIPLIMKRKDMNKNLLQKFAKERRSVFQVLVIFISFFYTSSLYGQSRNETKTVLKNVADQIIQKTSYRFKNVKTGELYKSTQGLSEKMDIYAESRANKWEYVNGVLDIGMLQLGKILHEDKYIDYAVHNFDFIFSNIEFFRKKYNGGNHHTEYTPFFRMGSLDDCGTMGAALIEVNNIAHKHSYRNYIDEAAKYISTGQDRLPDGTLARNHPRKMTMWGDDLYMSVSFLSRMGKLTGDDKYFEDAIKQVENFNKYLYDPATGLMFHNWYSDVKMNGVAHWGRANGWIMMAQVNLLQYLPESNPKRAELIHLLLRQIVGESRYQDNSGLWHQILDRPDSYLETSVTAMFVYSIAKAVNEGWIPDSYLSVAKRGWKGLLTKINKYGEVENVCIGTGIQDDIYFYYNRPKVLNDLHALGPVLLAGSELLKSDK